MKCIIMVYITNGTIRNRDMYSNKESNIKQHGRLNL